MRARTSADLSIGDINLFIFGGLKSPRDSNEVNGGRTYITELTWNTE